MPDLVIKKVMKFGAAAHTLDFVDQNGVLFKWNKDVATLATDVLLEKDVVLYPTVTAEFPGVALTRDVEAIKEEFKLHGRVEDLATNNLPLTTLCMPRSPLQEPK
jgi:hypothetical protein